MLYSTILTTLVAAAASAASIPSADPPARLPLFREGRDMVDSDGKIITYSGINWPGAADTMLPEGLLYQSAEQIARRIKDMGLNVVRLTFPIELVDDIYETNGADVTLQDALTRALGSENGTRVEEEILQNNPQFHGRTTRLDVVDAVAQALHNEGLMLHLDNHVSKAMWCCSLTDGNGRFGDTYFNVTNWIRGLSFMAAHGAKHWPNFASIGLRNELRDGGGEPYLWSVWKTNMVNAANAVYEANPNILLFFSGGNYDVTLDTITTGATLDDGSVFSIDDYSFKNKFVFELHSYDSVSDAAAT